MCVCVCVCVCEEGHQPGLRESVSTAGVDHFLLWTFSSTTTRDCHSVVVRLTLHTHPLFCSPPSLLSPPPRHSLCVPSPLSHTLPSLSFSHSVCLTLFLPLSISVSVCLCLSVCLSLVIPVQQCLCLAPAAHLHYVYSCMFWVAFRFAFFTHCSSVVAYILHWGCGWWWYLTLPPRSPLYSHVSLAWLISLGFLTCSR